MDYLPIFIDLRGRACLIVGGGPVALRKLELLQRAGAEPRVVAPALCAPLRALAATSLLRVALREYSAHDLDGVQLVVAATDSADVNARVARDAQARAVPVNVVDSPALCSFIMPAIVDRSPLLVAISTAGASPVLARLTRARVEAALPPGLGRLAAFAARHRALVQQKIKGSGLRRLFWERALEGEIAELVMSERDAQADLQLQLALSTGHPPAAEPVALIACGDGDPDRLSLGALRSLSRADLLLYEAEVPPQVLSFARRDAERIDVGRLGSPTGWSFERLASAVADCARQRRVACVVRADDPYLGELTEDARRLRDAGLRVAILRPAPG
jgi:uroporphyrin-III C-methyltransferase/precorrin-2 dehydrogenase/sirohydrochlorin ferrochelatase